MLSTPSDAQEIKLLPWEANPYEPVSLDMFLNSAYLFCMIGQMLEALFQEALTKPTGDIPYDPRVHRLPIDDALRDKALKTFQVITDDCGKVGMPISAETAQELYDKVQKNAKYDYDTLMSDSRALQRLLFKEMKGKMFLYMTPERARFWPRSDVFIFGDKVLAAFPSVSYDAMEGGACLALARSTACVFHLMRVLEIALGVLGGKFDVSLAHTNWQNAIDQLEKKIGQMGQDPTWKAQTDWKEQQEFYAQAVSYLRVVKDAWRNFTAHTHGKFTEQEGQLIFENIRNFMQKMSERLSE